MTSSFHSTIAATPSRRNQTPKKPSAWLGDFDSESDFAADDDNDDADATDFDASSTIPCSPYITQPTQKVVPASHTTQPTLIAGAAAGSGLTQPTLVVAKPDASRIPSGAAAGAAIPSSSPPPPPPRPPPQSSDAVVEVPASSPFRHRPSPGPKEPKGPQQSLGSRIAPAGTAFRPPAELLLVRSPPPTMLGKRPAPEPITLSSDDEDDFSARRGDITRTDFVRQISQFAHVDGANPAAASRAPQNAFGVMMAKKKADKENVEAPAPAPTRRRLVQGRRPDPSSVPSSPPPQVSESFARRSEWPPVKPKRRLQRGLPPRSSPVSSQWQPQRAASPENPILIASSDDDGGFAVETEEEESEGESNEPLSDNRARLLACLNDAPMEDIKAMSKRDEGDLKLFIAKRPFHSIAQARAVNARKPGSKKAARIQVGDAIVDAINDFLRATEAIDGVVAECEAKAQQAKREMDAWNVDMRGVQRGAAAAAAAADEDRPLTPRSLKEYRDPPIPKQPAMMDGHCQMKEFQRFGLNWMNMCFRNRVGCILADEMGLGKTCQVISFMCHLVESGLRHGEVNWPNLIVVPPSTYDNWWAEFEKFAGDGVRVAGYQGSAAARVEIGEEILEARHEYHVVLTTYTQVVGKDDREFLRALRPVAAVFDEGHKMKNPDTKIYGALRRVRADWRLLLTGTPVQNNLSEMIALLSFINPALFGEGADEYLKTMFSSKVSARDVGNSAFLYSERVRRARTILEPFILRRVKQQVVEMPAKVRTVVHCDLPPSQRPLYDEYEAVFRRDPAVVGGGEDGGGTTAAKKKRPAGGGSGGARGNDQNNVWVQLRKAALHPHLFRRVFDDAKVERMARILMAKVPQRELQQDNLVHLTNELRSLSDFELHLWCRDYERLIGDFDLSPDAFLESGKVTKLLELVAQYRAAGDRVLVFSKFAKMLDILAEVLATAGVRHCVLSGQTNVQERQALIDEFTDDADISVFLLTTAAGGTGINLTAANKVVIFDQSDNPQDDIQAENRAHRLGQTKEVEIVRLIARGTVEELIYRACEKKIMLANRVTGAEEDEEAVAGAAAERTLETEVRLMMGGKQPTPP
jgi:SWI/SNF-related matrix-associated actin-dependent regulator 1 of chromatin subfamily A